MRRSRHTVVLTSAMAGLMAVSGITAGAISAQSERPEGTLHITHWDFLAPAYGETMQALIQGYGEANPAATVSTQGIVRADYETTLKTQLSAGAGPDVFAIADTFLPELAEAGLLEPLDGIFPEELAATMNSTNEGGMWRGQQLAITWQIAPYALIWNKDILEEAGVEPPTTMEELIAAAVTIQERTGKLGFAVRHRLAEEVPWWIDFNNWPQGFGGGWSDGTSLTIDRPENVAAVEALKAIYDSGAFAVGDDASTFRTRFREGQLAMMIDATGSPPAMAGEIVPSTSILSSALPFPTPGTSRVGIYFGINANSPNKELAKDFLRWFVTADVQQPLSEILGHASTMATDTTVPDEFLEANPWVAAYRANAPFSNSSVILGFETATPQIRNIVLGWIERVLVEDLPAAEALANAAAEVEEQVDLGG